MLELNKIYNEDCLEGMKKIPDGSIDCIICDSPYEATNCDWDKKMFRYEWIWEKTTTTGFLNANKMPLRSHENILVFYQALPTYNPQKTKSDKPKSYSGKNKETPRTYSIRGEKSETYSYKDDGLRFPKDIIKSNREIELIHPTQKPLALVEYLIKTYTNEGEIVLDACMGSGTTAVAAINTGRNFVGFELDEKYFKVATDRIEKHIAEKEMRLFDL